MNKKVFDDGLTEIEIAFINFTMTKSRADIWYKYSKHLEDSRWQKKISACIKGCRKVPTLADILDIKGYYRESEVAGDKIYEVEDDIKNFKYTPIPEDVKEKMNKFKNGLSMPKKG